MHKCDPQEVGFSAERLGKINTVMQRYVDERKLAGIVTLWQTILRVWFIKR